MACPHGGYPDAPEGATQVLHVAEGCPAEGADGSAGFPYPSLGEAVERARSGAAVLIAPGSYAEHLKVEQGIALIGAPSSAEGGAGGVEIAPGGEPGTNCSGEPSRVAIFVCGGHDVQIRGLHIREASAAAIGVRRATIAIEGVVVEGTQVEEGQFGYGIFVAEDGKLLLRDSVIEGSADIGVLVADSTARLERNTIRGNGAVGVRISNSTEPAEVVENTIEDNVDVGVVVLSAEVSLLRNIIRGTRSRNNSGHGIAVTAQRNDDGEREGPADVEIEGNEISNNDMTGIYLTESTRAAVVRDNTIARNALAGAVGGGLIWSANRLGEESVIEGNRLQGNRFMGIFLTGETGGILVQDNTVEATELGEVRIGAWDEERFEVGDGISLTRRSSARLLRNTVRESGRIGLILDTADGARTTIDGNLFEENADYAVVLQNQEVEPGLSANVLRANGLDEVRSTLAGEYRVWLGEEKQ
jgi:parallel beta-helix repeat protein